MDLGAMVCTRNKPSCHVCPLAAHCIALAKGLQTQLPTRRPKRPRPHRIAFVAVISNTSQAVLLQQRPAAGVWGGLWVFPQFDDEASCKAFIQSKVMSASAVRGLLAIQHTFTHFDLTLHPLWSTAAIIRSAVAEEVGYCWYDPHQPARIGLAKPVLDILKLLTITPSVEVSEA